MKRLNKPKKYSEINVEFYANEVTPVSGVASSNSSTYQNPYNGAYYSSNSNSSSNSNQTNKSNSGNKGLSFGQILNSKLNGN